MKEGGTSMLYAGIDIAKRRHMACITDALGNKIAGPFAFDNTRQGFALFTKRMEEACGEEEVVVGMEATGHYWMALFSHLQQAGICACLINPVKTDAWRRFLGSSKVKTDAIDCAIIADAMRIGAFDPSMLACEEIGELKALTRMRQDLSESTSALKCRIIAALDRVFPEYAKLFSDAFSASSKAILKRCPTPKECSKVKASSLERILAKASRGKCGYEKAQKIKAAARESCGAAFADRAISFEIKSLVAQLEFIERQIDEADLMIRELLDGIEPLVLTIPGISYAIGAQIVAEIGDINRFDNSDALVSFAGLNPSKNESGEFSSTENRITKQGSPYLRRALYLAAQAQLVQGNAFRAFYDRLRGRGKRHRVALVAVAAKIARVVFAVLSKQEPYREEAVGVATS